MADQNPPNWADQTDPERQDFLAKILELTTTDDDFRDRCLKSPDSALAALKEAMAEGSVPAVTLPEDFSIEFYEPNLQDRNSPRVILKMPAKGTSNIPLKDYVVCTYPQWLQADSSSNP
jgi:hypothetical protein